MLTRDRALEIAHARGTFHRDGYCIRSIGIKGAVKEKRQLWRTNGAPQLWKRTPEKFRVPIKHGLNQCWEINQDNLSEFHADNDCPLNAPGALIEIAFDEIGAQKRAIINAIASIAINLKNEHFKEKHSLMPMWLYAVEKLEQFTPANDGDRLAVEIWATRLNELRQEIANVIMERAENRAIAHNAELRQALDTDIHAWASYVARDL